MKENIHPRYEETEFKCACGNVVKTRSTAGSSIVSVDVCSKCHPYYTGKQRFVDSSGRVDKFNKRWANAK